MRQNRIVWSLLMVLTLAAGTACAQSGDGAQSAEVLALGAPAPMADVAMKGVDGKALTIAQAAGKKGTLVIFTCNACPWVKRWETRIAAIGNAAKAKGIGVVAINSNEAINPEDGFPEMQKRAKKLGLKFPYVQDETSDVARAFGATRTPEVFLFDAAGKLVYHGAIDDNAQDAKAVTKPYLTDAVNAVAAGSAVSTAETKALGCSIKFRKAKQQAS
jgi:peroxiredoxin